MIIAGDFSAWAVEWYSVEMNTKGDALLESFSSLGYLVLINYAKLLIFCKVGTSSIITSLLPLVAGCGSSWLEGQ